MASGSRHARAKAIPGTVYLACGLATCGLFHGRRWGHRLAEAPLLVNLNGDLIDVGPGIEPQAIIGIPIVALLPAYLASRKVRRFFTPTAASAA